MNKRTEGQKDRRTEGQKDRRKKGKKERRKEGKKEKRKKGRNITDSLPSMSRARSLREGGGEGGKGGRN
jgi:hypothetical protein